MAAIRHALASDYEAFCAMFGELHVPEPVPVFEATFMPNAFVACEGERVLGYGHGLRVGPSWHVMHVVTAPEARGRGVGRAIMDEHARRARAAGASRWWLSVKRANATAIRLYERCGLAVAVATWAMIIDWADVARLPPAPAPFTTFVVEPDVDAAIERALSLTAGEVASHRARPGRVIVGVRASKREELVGYASFAPAFPGAFPFRPRDAAWVRALFEAMRPHALPEHTSVRMVVERDEALMETCADAGGRVLLEMYRMEGDVPAEPSRSRPT
jgi:GNAT superfamily N-acetyltransferase